MPRSSDTEITGLPVCAAVRSAVRCLEPVSRVGSDGSGIRWTLARTMTSPSSSRMIAPSILASSARRAGEKFASASEKPPEQIDWTLGSQPMMTSAPFDCWMIRSSAILRSVPGASRSRMEMKPPRPSVTARESSRFAALDR